MRCPLALEGPDLLSPAVDALTHNVAIAHHAGYGGNDLGVKALKTIVYNAHLGPSFSPLRVDPAPP